MCTEHWRAYVKGLADARKAASPKAVALVTTDGDVPLSEAGAAKVTRVVRKAAHKTKADPKIAAAEALIAEVDALPGSQHVTRVGDADVQAALETVTAANGSVRGTPLGETIDGGTEEADAA